MNVLETSVLMMGGAAGGEGNEVTLQRISAGEVLKALRPLPPFFWGLSLGAESGWGAGVDTVWAASARCSVGERCLEVPSSSCFQWVGDAA